MYDSLLPCITGPYHIESTAQRHIFGLHNTLITLSSIEIRNFGVLCL